MLLLCECFRVKGSECRQPLTPVWAAGSSVGSVLLLPEPASIRWPCQSTVISITPPLSLCHPLLSAASPIKTPLRSSFLFAFPVLRISHFCFSSSTAARLQSRRYMKSCLYIG
ncbi:hypothetical protein QQF64_005892 [Cirrhinus molitorella]|uniref:Uncharacterized protein n=1 Tax=Cirrhinus molitorella TaxID=172907 RepID=A0ABR3MDI2_9TELE